MSKSLPHNSLKRLLRGTSSLVYLVVLLSAPGLDAILEAKTVEPQTHVESQSENICTTGHDEYLCQLCRLLDIPGDHAAVHAELPAKARLRASGWGFRTPIHSLPEQPHHSRAPPIV